MVSLERPWAAIRTILARITSRYGDVYLRTLDFNSCRSSFVRTTVKGLCLGIEATSAETIVTQKYVIVFMKTSTKLTLRAVAPASALPRADFSQVRDARLKAEIESDWASLQDHVANKHGYEAITASKNVVEALLADLLGAGNLVDKLERLEKTHRADPNSAPMGWFEHHLAQKIRYLHQRTHPERSATSELRRREPSGNPAPEAA